MQDFEELFQSTKSAIDSLKDGLQSISVEEHQLLMLRNQLTKIKKIREEQHKKDSLIATLKERIAVLEHSAKSSEKQSAEVSVEPILTQHTRYFDIYPLLQYLQPIMQLTI